LERHGQSISATSGKCLTHIGVHLSQVLPIQARASLNVNSTELWQIGGDFYMTTTSYHEFLHIMARVIRTIRRHLGADIDNTPGRPKEKEDSEIATMLNTVLRGILAQAGALVELY
jgi:hypothetical protein